MGEIYEPAEDSFLMQKVLEEKIPKLIEENFNLKVLEVGCGSGILLKTLEDLKIKNENILGVDINPDTVECCKKLGFNVIESDLFKRVPRGNFDVIIFNPPYLPRDEEEPEESRVITTGGEKGNELITRFLAEVKDYLEERGKIFLITSSLAEDVNFGKLDYDAKKIKTEKMFFEELGVWELWRK